MKLRLKNFRCYEDRTFDLGENGLSLLSGQSGTGKSTILIGIYFGLYGTGFKLAKHGEKSCLVELEFEDLTIKRTKRPNRLVVNDVYEDQAGQNIINKKFGDTFNTCGYIAQNALNSFILMNPADKLCFLEKFAFKDINLGEVKNRCKSHINKTHDELISVVSQLELAEKVLNEMSEPEKVLFPIKCKKNQITKVIKNEIIKHKNCNILIKRKRKNISSVYEELGEVKVLDSYISSESNNLNKIESKLVDIKNSLLYVNFFGDEQLEECKNNLKSILNRKEYNNLKKIYDDDIVKLKLMKEQEISDINLEIEKISSILWKKHSEDIVEENLEVYKNCLIDMEKLSVLRKSLVKYTTDTNSIKNSKNRYNNTLTELDKQKNNLSLLKLQEKSYSCPSCNEKLCFSNNELSILKDTIDSSIDKNSIIKNIKLLKEEISTLSLIISKANNHIEKYNEIKSEIENILSGYEEEMEINKLKEEIEYLEKYKNKQYQYGKQLDNLHHNYKNRMFSSSYISFENSVKDKEKKLEQLENIDPEFVIIPEEQLRTIINDEINNKNKLINLQKQESILEEEKKQCLNNIINAKDKHIKKYNTIKKESLFHQDIKNLEEDIEEIEQKQEKHKINLEKIEEYNQYIEKYDNYNSWKTKVTELRKAEDIAKNKHAAALLFKTKILEAESIAVSNIVSSIDMHAQIYLDCFFPDETIMVRLLPFKEVKKNTKPQINLEIEYKNMECDLNTLSGGELSRVILAYTLALGEMFNIPLLMLDECTSSLDQETTSLVFDSIKENFSNKLVLIIAHQITTGIFDKVIEFKN